MNPLRRMKDWLSAAIDWRVRDEVKVEREVIATLAETVTHVASTTAEQQRAIGSLLENLERRVAKLEKDSGQ
jgi:ABC-type molybdenum transport system ATPase subunit/photorepair protein PhrA